MWAFVGWSAECWLTKIVEDMAPLKTPAAIWTKENISGFTLIIINKGLQGMIKKKSECRFWNERKVNRMHFLYIVNQVIQLQI